MQGKLTKKIDKLKDIPPYYYYLSTGAKPSSTQVSSALLHLQLSSEKAPLLTEILYANRHCLCGYMKLLIYSLCVNTRINVYIYYNVMCICIVLTVNIMPFWWATTQSSQLWSLVPPKALPCSSWPAIWPWLSMWTPGETFPYILIWSDMMFSAHVIIKRSCPICLSD